MARWIQGVKVEDISHRLYQPSGRLEFGEAIQSFQERVRKGEARIPLLQEFAELLIWATSSYSVRRKGKLGRGRLGHGICFGCQMKKQLVRHHIIQVSNGGPNRRSNLVGVCYRCHAEIHPWMRRKDAVPFDAFAPMWAKDSRE